MKSCHRHPSWYCENVAHLCTREFFIALRKQRLEGTVLVLVLVRGLGQKVLVGRVFFNTMISAHPIMSTYSTYCT